MPGVEGRTLIEEAREAVGTRPVLHVVAESSVPGAQVYELATSSARAQAIRVESWYDADRHWVHTRVYRDGALVDDALETPSGGESNHGAIVERPGFVPTVDPALAAFVTGYAAALSSGDATEAGSGSIEGMTVKWLDFRAAGPPGVVGRVAVDAQTGKPVAFGPVIDGSLALTWRVLRIETLERPDANFERPRVATWDPSVGAVQSSTPLDIAGRSALPASALWLGPSFRGAPAQVNIQQLVTGFPRESGLPSVDATGIEIRYGSGSGAIVLREARSPQQAYQFPAGRTFSGGGVPPSGSVAITNGSLGQLRQAGWYVTINAPSAGDVVEIARALHALGVDEGKP
jgi:hypothetical protein